MMNWTEKTSGSEQTIIDTNKHKKGEEKKNPTKMEEGIKEQ